MSLISNLIDIRPRIFGRLNVIIKYRDTSVWYTYQHGRTWLVLCNRHINLKQMDTYISPYLGKPHIVLKNFQKILAITRLLCGHFVQDVYQIWYPSTLIIGLPGYQIWYVSYTKWPCNNHIIYTTVCLKFFRTTHAVFPNNVTH